MFAQIGNNFIHSLWKGALAALVGGIASLAPFIAAGNIKGAVMAGVSLIVWGALHGVGVEPPKAA